MKKILTIIIVVAALQLGAVSIASASGGNYHKVRYGETLYSIGRMYGVSAYNIAQTNGLYNPNRIYAGQVLYIPAGGYGHYDRDYDCGYGCGRYDGGDYHRVRYGETLYSIGRRYNVHPNHIAEANGLYNPNYIYAGQVLHIPSGSQYPWPSRHHGQYGYGNYGYGHGYGYDYTGYYYSYGQKQYSYTCGYYYNCW